MPRSVQKTALRGGKKFVTLTIAFNNLDDLKQFVEESFGDDVSVYQGDGMDREFTGHVPAGTFVVRHTGQKPDGMLA